MFHGKSIAVVVPCYDEETQITGVLETMPALVDAVFVVDDCSRDATTKVVREWTAANDAEGRVTLIELERNSGVGAAINAGYRAALRGGHDVAAVMAGDGQMDPDELPQIVGPVARGEADYAKGNRLFYQDAFKTIPRIRYFGNAALSMLTKIASGYWHVADSQGGYTAISREALESLDLDRIYPSYGYPNDVLVRLNVEEQRVADVLIRPVYGVGERSKMRILKVMPRIAWLILRRYLWRMREKYVVRDFHPLVLFNLFGAGALAAGSALGLYLVGHRLAVGPVATTSALFATFLFVTGLQLLLFAMWFDMQANRDLCVRIRTRRRRDTPENRPEEPAAAEPEAPAPVPEEPQPAAAAPPRDA